MTRNETKIVKRYRRKGQEEEREITTWTMENVHDPRRVVAPSLLSFPIGGSQSFGRCPSSLWIPRETHRGRVKDRRDAKRREDGGSVYQPSDNLAHRRGIPPFPSTRSRFCTRNERTYVRRYNLNNSFEYSCIRIPDITFIHVIPRQVPRDKEYIRGCGKILAVVGRRGGGGFNFIGMAVIFHFSPPLPRFPSHPYLG